MIKRNLLVCLLVLFSCPLFSQIDYHKQYFNAKALFRQGKYNLTIETLKPLIAYDKSNPYSEYALFYSALAAYNQNYKAVAKDMLNQIRSLYPKWDKMDEVNFWLGIIHFENRDYFQGLKIFQAIQDKKFEKDIEAAKAKHIVTVTDIETLKMMLEEYPKDHVIARSLATALAKNVSTNPEDKVHLESLIERFKFKRTDFLPEAPKTFHKERYSVSVLLPFMLNTLEPTPGKKRNQIVLDFYEGLKLASDTLNKQGVSISVRAYDTDGGAEKVKRILNTEELLYTDLIVGPLFPEEIKLVQEFSMTNKVNVIHPITNNSELIGLNPYAFLFQPSSETLGRKSAEYLADRTGRRKNCLVFYGTAKKDSAMMASFVQTATAKGLHVVASQRITKSEGEKIFAILQTATEFDEFKFPKQFTLKKDSIGSIYVASDEALIYTRIMSSIERRGDSIQVVGSENWLDDNIVDLEKYETLKVVLTAPNFADSESAQHKDFVNKFIKKYSRTPSTIARMGYEFMFFFGNQLKTNGVYFQDVLGTIPFQKGYTTAGYNYQNSRDNQLVPFVTFRRGKLTLVEKR